MPATRFPRRKRIRLSPSTYAECGAICAITIGTHHRRRVFSEVRAAAAVVAVLREHSGITCVPVYGFCVMPDHVHLVLGASATCDIVTFVGQFKNLAQPALRKLGVRDGIWQRSFYDRFLRADEQLDGVIEYVLDNPVRAGLVETRSAYLFAGCLASCT